ncbi:MAG: urea carboxylase-associated family protein [Alphaproteobacteria bacterium]|nr:urea carboxylase-associated family protein [Alphaproteobacteria bacterium]
MSTWDGLVIGRDNGDEDGQNATLTEPISPDGTPDLGATYQVAARCGRAVRVRRGQFIKIINTHGSQVCDTWAFNADALAEFLSMEHARAWLARMTPKVADVLVTNRRRPILTLMEDSSPGVHDTFVAACDLWRYRTLGVEGYHDNCADNLRMAMKAIGMRVTEVPSPLNLWMNIPIEVDLSIDFLPPVTKAGDHVLLRAEMDCVVAMSSCPQDIIPINGEACTPQELHFEVHPA